MTSAIISSTINTAFPVAGQDNNSQGFRDNFTVIQTALAEAATEITALQANGINVTNSTNSLQGSTLTNGLYSQFYPVADSLGTINSSTTIDLNNGSVQYGLINATGLTLTFANWPTTGYGTIKLILKFSQSLATTTNLSTTNSGKLVVDSSWTGSVFQQSGVIGTNVQIVYPGSGNLMYVIDAFSYDAGAHVYIKVGGTYSSAI
jgi:hypothetical protein